MFKKVLIFSCLSLVAVFLCWWLFCWKQDPLQQDSTIPIWQEQIKYAQNKNKIATETYDSNKPCLLSYTYKGKIDSGIKRQELLKELFADTTNFILFADSGDFEILPLQEIVRRTKIAGILHDPCEQLKLYLDTIIHVGMEMVQLKWRYQERDFYSMAIVSDKGFVYDHIASMITEKSEEVSDERWLDSLSFSDKEIGFIDLQTLKEDFSVFHDGLKPDAWEITGIANLKTEQGHVAVVRYETLTHQTGRFVVILSNGVYIDNCTVDFIDCDLKSDVQFYRNKDESFKLLVKIEPDGYCALTSVKEGKNGGIEYGAILTNSKKRK